MKTMIAVLIGVFLAMGLSAQDKDQTRQEKKEAKKALRDSEYRMTENMIDSMDFVLEAYYLANKVGRRVPVSSNINFIKVDSLKTVIQTGNTGGAGSNGVGGVTAEGKITNWRVDKNPKNKSFTINMDVMTNLGIYSVIMHVSSAGRADARLTGLWPGELNWDGQLIPNGNSRVYKGRTSY